MQVIPLVLIKRPKEHQMSLSNQVKESVNQAINNLREGLAFAARSEHTSVIASLSDIIARLEHLEELEKFIQSMEASSNDNGENRPIFRLQ
jgi:hypothetical protein